MTIIDDNLKKVLNEQPTEETKPNFWLEKLKEVGIAFIITACMYYIFLIKLIGDITTRLLVTEAILLFIMTIFFLKKNLRYDYSYTKSCFIGIVNGVIITIPTIFLGNIVDGIPYVLTVSLVGIMTGLGYMTIKLTSGFVYRFKSNIKTLARIEDIKKKITITKNSNSKDYHCERCGMIYDKKISRCKVCNSKEIIS